jgi:hypothetical protein
MEQQVVDVGVIANDGTGTPLRDAFVMVNENFTDLYEGALLPDENGDRHADGPLVVDGPITAPWGFFPGPPDVITVWPEAPSVDIGMVHAGGGFYGVVQAIDRTPEADPNWLKMEYRGSTHDFLAGSNSPLKKALTIEDWGAYVYGFLGVKHQTTPTHEFGLYVSTPTTGCGLWSWDYDADKYTPFTLSGRRVRIQHYGATGEADWPGGAVRLEVNHPTTEFTFFDTWRVALFNSELPGYAYTFVSNLTETVVAGPLGASAKPHISVTPDHLELKNLPTANPGGSGRVWNDGGTLKIT